MTNKKLAAQAKKARALFEYHEDTKDDRDNITREAFWSFNNTALSAMENPLYRAMSEAIHTAEVAEDSAYLFTVEALDAIIDILETSINADPEDNDIVDAYSEAPIYTSELLEWLAKGTSHMAWVEDAINDFGWTKDSTLVQAIQYGYSEAWKSQYYKVLEALKA
jgi:hypothetical protein